MDELIKPEIETEVKKIEMFTAPKPVVKKKERDVIFVQTVFCGVLLAGILLLKILLPEVYENIAKVFGEYIL